MHSSWYIIILENKNEAKDWKRGEEVNAQFKKGVLELIVLKSVIHQDMYGYELVEEVSKVIDVNEGTIYPLLKRLTNEHYFETYLKESTEGPPRKYYHITATGILYQSELEEEWNEFSKRVGDFLKERKG
jgi:PadR family transcriptional regulator PadR